VRLLSIGDQIKPGTYPFHSAFDRAINFAHSDRLVSVVTEDIGPGPLNIVIREPLTDGGGSKAFPPLRITAKTIAFANCHLRFSSRHRYNSSFDFIPDDLRCDQVRSPAFRWLARRNKNGSLRRLRRNLAALRKLLTTKSPPRSLALILDDTRAKNFRSPSARAFARQALRGAAYIFQGDLLKGVRILKGCGPGLTPAGDDFIAGILIGLNLLQILSGRNLEPLAGRVFHAAQGANIFSNTFLCLARRGLLFGRIKDLLTAMLAGNQQAVRRAAANLFAIGATSGADLAAGIFVTVTGRLGLQLPLCLAPAFR
jgi:hypothetical protein